MFSGRRVYPILWRHGFAEGMRRSLNSSASVLIAYRGRRILGEIPKNKYLQETAKISWPLKTTECLKTAEVRTEVRDSSGITRKTRQTPDLIFRAEKDTNQPDISSPPLHHSCLFYRVPPNPADISLLSTTPPMPSCAGPKNAPVTSPASPPVWMKVFFLTMTL